MTDNMDIYIIITKNIRYLLWNRGFWRLLNNTYTIFLTPCIRCTNHLCDSYGLIDVNPHFIPSLIPMIQNVDLLWRHRYKSWPPAIVTSQWPIVPAWFLWTRSYWLWLCYTIIYISRTRGTVPLMNSMHGFGTELIRNLAIWLAENHLFNLQSLLI